MIKLILLLLFSTSVFAETLAKLSWECIDKREDGTFFDCETELKEFIVKAATSGPIEDWEPLYIGKETNTTLKIEDGVRYTFAIFVVDTAGNIAEPGLSDEVFIPKTIEIPISAPRGVSEVQVRIIFTDEE